MKITLTANAGFLLEADGINFLFDSFHTKKTGMFSPLPESLQKDLANSSGLFKHIDAALVTHSHPDHSDETCLYAFMATRPNTHLIFPAKEDTALGCYFVRGAKVWTGMLTHEGAEYSNCPNYGFYIETAEGNFLALGDAALNMEQIAGFLAGRPVDVCVLNFPFFALSKGHEILNLIAPKLAVAIHLPFEEDDTPGYASSVRRGISKAAFPFETAVLNRPLAAVSYNKCDRT